MLSKVDLGRGNHAGIDVDCLVTPKATNLTFLQDSEEFALEFWRKVVDVIQEYRATMRGLEETRPGLIGTGVSTDNVAEQFVLDQRRWHARATQGDEGPAAAVTAGVNSVRNEFFAGTGFPDNQHSGIARSGALDEIPDFLHWRSDADHPVEGGRI